MYNKIITENEMNFNEFEKKIFKFVCLIGCMLIKYFLEKQDKKLANTRDKTLYRNKGKRKNTIKTIMGEVEYERTMYVFEGKYIFLLDEKLKIGASGKISDNLVEKVVEVAAESRSYRAAKKKLELISNITISYQWINKLTVETGEKIAQKEKEEMMFMDKNQLIEGTREIVALFEETDGLWINLQGNDRKTRLKKQQEELEKKGKSLNPKAKIKTELKLHVMYEGWKKGDTRHTLINKQAIAGIMKPKEIVRLRDARIYQKYKADKIKLRVVNADGAKWTKGITPKDGVYQKDAFHIQQEIVRDVPKEYRNTIIKLIEEKEYGLIPNVIEKLKYEVGGEEKAIKKLDTLKSYLSSGMARYQDIAKVPQAPDGIEYRNMGTQESQIFSFLKVRFCSGRKAFSIRGANALAKVCVAVKERNLKIEEIETPIPIDKSDEEWIEEIEKQLKLHRNKVKISNNIKNENNCKNINLGNAPKFLREILKEKSFIDIKCSY
jgi:hypothetical protein